MVELVGVVDVPRLSGWGGVEGGMFPVGASVSRRRVIHDSVTKKDGKRWRGPRKEYRE